MTYLKKWEAELEKFNYGREVLISSRIVAEVFEKQHYHVVRDIEKTSETIDRIGKASEKLDNTKLGSTYFIKSVYKDGNNRPRTEYLLTKDGLTLIVMGFKGEKAFDFKIAFIKKFNEMEQKITAVKSIRKDNIKLSQSIIKGYE